METQELIRNIIRPFTAGAEPLMFKPQDLQSVDGNRFLAQVEREGLTGLVYHCLKNYYRDQSVLPQETYEEIEDEFIKNVGRNMIMQHELEEVCRGFEDNQVPAVIFRGGAFLNELYTDRGIRPLIDIDFVIKKEDCQRASAALKENGFKNYPEFPYFFFKDDVYIDLHLDSINFWRIKDWPSHLRISNNDVWRVTRPFMNNKHVRMFSIMDTILHCCEHVERHSFSRLIWFVDIAAMIKKNGDSLQWDELINRARHLNVHKPLFYVLSYLKIMELVSIPPGVMVNACPNNLNFIEEKYYWALLKNERETISGDILSLLNISSLGLRLRVLFNGIFVEKDKFPLLRDKLTFKHYVKRFFRLFNFAAKKTYLLFKPAR